MKLTIDIPKYMFELKAKQISKALGGAARLVANQAKADILSSAGLPGGAPKNRTGALVKGITSRSKKWVALVISNDPGSTALQVGATGGGGNKKGVRNKRGKPSTKRVMPAYPYMENVH